MLDAIASAIWKAVFGIVCLAAASALFSFTAFVVFCFYLVGTGQIP